MFADFSENPYPEMQEQIADWKSVVLNFILRT